MFMIRAYRWTLKALHTALTKAYEQKEREVETAERVIAALKQKANKSRTEALELEVQAFNVKRLLG